MRILRYIHTFFLIQSSFFFPFEGMVQLEFQLHDEAEKGFYQIMLTRRDAEDESKQFEVKEYG